MMKPMRWIHGSLITFSIALLAILLGIGVALDPWVALGAVLVEVGLMVAIVRNSSLVQVGAFLAAGGFAAWAFTSDSTLFGSSFINGSVSPSPAKQIPVLVMALGLLLSYLPSANRRAIARHFRGQGSITALVYYSSAVVVAAAVSPIIAIAGLRVAQMLIPVAAALALSRKNPHLALILAIAACIVHSALGILFPQDVNGGFGIERVSGYLQVNTYAFAGAVTAVVGVWLWLHKHQRSLAVILLVLGITAIMTARSRTALVAGAVAMAVTMYTARKEGANRDPILIRTTATTLICGTVLACYPGGVLGGEGSAMGEYFARGNAGDVMTFTGRERLWAYAIHMAGDRPFFGFGPGSLRAGPFADQVRITLGYGGQAHNAAVGAYVESGILGLVGWLALIFYTFAAIRRTRNASRPLLLGIFALVILSAMTEAGPSGFGLFWATLLGVTVAAAGTADPNIPDQHVRQTVGTERKVVN
jgi:O-antigen ligase